MSLNSSDLKYFYSKKRAPKHHPTPQASCLRRDHFQHIKGARKYGNYIIFQDCMTNKETLHTIATAIIAIINSGVKRADKETSSQSKESPEIIE
jgi:hypothetical protein